MRKLYIVQLTKQERVELQSPQEAPLAWRLAAFIVRMLGAGPTSGIRLFLLTPAFTAYLHCGPGRTVIAEEHSGSRLLLALDADLGVKASAWEA